MHDIRRLAHTKWNCKYHIVFAPKYRRQVIYGQIKKDIGQIKERYKTDKERYRTDKERYRTDKERYRTDKERYRTDKERYRTDIKRIMRVQRCRNNPSKCV